jgi:hypothetical protein
MSLFPTRLGERIFSRLRTGIGLAGIASILAATAPVAPARADTPLDYMVQQVCDDGAGGHTSADPTTCPTTARKLRIGEALPYHKWDGANAASARQISDSYPIADLYGRARAVSTMVFDNQLTFSDPVFDAAHPSPWISAYNILIADGSYLSFAGTYDPGRGWQPFWQNSTCSYADSWIVAPKTSLIPFGEGHTVAKLSNAYPNCPTVKNVNKSITYWNNYSNYIYDSGKSLNTIKSWHFSAGSWGDSDGLEEFMFTKEYGLTRWEAWRARSASIKSPNLDAVSHCPSGVDGGINYYGSNVFYLQDCHDWSHVVASPNGDWDPSKKWHIDPLYYSYNLLSNTHMQCTKSGIAQDCSNGGKCQTIQPWQRSGDLNWAYDSVLQGTGTTANCALKISIPSNYSNQSVYQDVMLPNAFGSFDPNLGIDLPPAPSPYSSYSFGAALWNPIGANGNASVVVQELGYSDNIIAEHSVQASLSSIPQFFSGAFTIDSQTAKMRFSIRPQTSNVEYEFTEAWVAPQP